MSVGWSDGHSLDPSCGREKLPDKKSSGLKYAQEGGTSPQGSFQSFAERPQEWAWDTSGGLWWVLSSSQLPLTSGQLRLFWPIRRDENPQVWLWPSPGARGGGSAAEPIVEGRTMVMIKTPFCLHRVCLLSSFSLIWLNTWLVASSAGCSLPLSHVFQRFCQVRIRKWK